MRDVVGPIVLTVTGQEFLDPCRIIGCLWVGSTTSGDYAQLNGRRASATHLLWGCQTDVSNTYLGAIWGTPGIHAPDGFKAENLPSGRLFVYISE